jgi:RNA polymerase sigma-70 factor (ECF subfamily)
MQDEKVRSSDEEIVRQVLDGNVNAFESVILRHRGLVVTIVKKHVPQDAVEETAQDVFVRAYRSLPTFKGTGGFSQWLSSIAVKTCYDYWRKAYRSREIPLSALTEKHTQWLEQVISRAPEVIPDEVQPQREAREVLDWALGKLSAGDRMVLELLYLEGLTVQEAAESLGWSKANVKVRSFRAKMKLEKILRRTMEQGGRER